MMYTIKGHGKTWNVGPYTCKTLTEAIKLSWLLWHLMNI